MLGAVVGGIVGVVVGVVVGVIVGVIVGVNVGIFVGVTVGIAVGVNVGVTVGVNVGVAVGAAVGILDGVIVVGTTLGDDVATDTFRILWLYASAIYTFPTVDYEIISIIINGKMYYEMYCGTGCIYDRSTWILQGCRGRCAVIATVASAACACKCSHRISRYSILGDALVFVIRDVHVPCAILG